MNKGMLIVGVCLLVLHASVCNADLVSWYQFSGNANDSAGGNHGTFMGNAAIATDPVRGQVASFDGNGDYVNIGNSTTIKPQLPMTLMAWVKPATSAGPQSIISLDSQNPRYYGACVNYETDATIGTAYMDGGSPSLSSRRSKGDGNTTLQMNQWYHVAVVLQGATNMQIYINGIDDGGRYEGTGDAIAYSMSNSYIGCRSGYERFLNGYIDDVRIYNNALTQQEVAQIIPEPTTLILFGIGMLGLFKRK